MWRIKKLFLIISLTITLASCTPDRETADIGRLVEPLQYFVRLEKTVDGDTITVADLDDFSKEITVNLCGIKSPDLNEKGGKESREALIQILKKAPNFVVYIVARDDFSDSEYNHAEVFFLSKVDGKEQDIFISAEIVRLGHAVVDKASINECLNGFMLEENKLS